MKRLIGAALAVAFTLSAAFAEEYVTTEITSKDRAMPTFYEQLKERMTFPLGWKDKSNPKKWKKAGLAKAKELIIMHEDTKPFDMKVLDEEQREGYKAQRVAFNISDTTRTLAYILIPDGVSESKKAPAILMLHAHGSEFRIGKEQMVRPFNSEKTSVALSWASRYYDNDESEGVFPGDEAAKRGYVVVAFDALGWGDRSVEGFKTDSQQALASNLYNMGTSFAGIIAQEDIRAAKFTASLPFVDKSKVAAMGFSMGGFRTWQLSALSDDIKAGVAVCWMGMMVNHMKIGDGQLKGNSAFSMLHPFIARYLDYPDVAGLAAPKPMMFIGGTDDAVNPTDGTKEAYEHMRKIWKANKAEDSLRTDLHEGMEHEFRMERQNEAFDWLDEKFGLKK